VPQRQACVRGRGLIPVATHVHITIHARGMREKQEGVPWWCLGSAQTAAT
jgi:hypothetical protein